MEQIKQRIAEVHTELEDNFAEVVEWRRYLHQHPELSFQETETARFIADKLRSFGYEDIQTNIGGYGIVATLAGKTAGPTIALRADFDALPIEDEKETAYRSKTSGVMHACGHDGHTAALLGTAKTLIKHKESLKGKVVFLFQPAEEVPPGGAKAMIEDGALDGVDYVYGAHLNSAAPIGKSVLAKASRWQQLINLRSPSKEKAVMAQLHMKLSIQLSSAVILSAHCRRLSAAESTLWNQQL